MRGGRVAACALTLALLISGGCGRAAPPGLPEVAAAEPVQVVVLADLDESGRLALARLAAQFEAESDATVQVVLREPRDYPSQARSEDASASRDPVVAALSAARGEGAPQLAIVDAEDLPQLLAEGGVRRVPGGAVRDLLPEARAAAGGERLLGVPLDVDLDVLFVRRGLVYQPPSAWSDVTGVAHDSTAGGREAGPIAMGAADADPIAALASVPEAAAASRRTGAGSGSGSGALAPPEDPAVEAALGMMRSWIASGDVSLAPDPAAAFISGQAGLALARASDLAPIEAALGGHDTFIVSALPDLPVHVRVAALIPRGTEEAREAAAEFQSFLAEPARQAFWAIQTSRLPAVAGAFEDPAWQAYRDHHPEVAAIEQAARSARAPAPARMAAARAALLALVSAAGGGGPGNR